MTDRDFIVERCDIRTPAALGLIAALNAELAGRYPEEGATHVRLDPDEVVEGRGAFLVASRAGLPIGCGGVRRIDEQQAEIKRMFVRFEERGQGVGRALPFALEVEARQFGVSRLVLETGIRQAEALALYERAGSSRIAPFGEYAGSPPSVCMAKAI